jgi:hypothetical protein
LLWLAIALVLVTAGLFLGNRALSLYADYGSASHWPTTTAVITRSTVEGERAFRPLLEYEYTVADTTYCDTSDLNMPGFGGRTNRYSAAENMAAEYPVGQQVDIYYNPGNPKESKLVISVPFGIYMQLAVAACLLLAGVLCGMVSVRLRAVSARR